MKSWRKVSLILAFLLIAGFDFPAYSIDSEFTRQFLRGIKQVTIGVDIDVDNFGFNAWELQNELAQRLRSSGIKVVPVKEATLEIPIVYVYFHILEIDYPKTQYCNYCFYIEVSLIRQVSLVEDPDKKFGATVWSSPSMSGRILSDKFIDKDRIKKYWIYPKVDRFISIYNSINKE